MKKTLSALLTVSVLIILFIGFVIVAVVSQMQGSEEKRKDFIELLDKTNYYFVGEVRLIEKIHKGVGFICLEKHEFNETGEKQLVFNNNIVSMLNDKGYVVQLGQISFRSKDNKELNVKVGDIVKYNFDNSGLYQVFRNDTLIYEDHAIIDNPTLQKRFLQFFQNSCK
ncbi:hypothetical protein [Flagellimonas meridianipacifica]|uniref:Uncharacterized protein n=1 Tax=Flagellimonas meridianipacifica TaxID=1080225 RepID=A0A2T0MJJ0_9FLAO|nr:hypothetical protein [Allomuricauda pacifica]PRX57729.1 hypothetical protein CLV81_1739 [Allomuricauda pacifica]